MAKVQWSASGDDGSQEIIPGSCRDNDGESPRGAAERVGDGGLVEDTGEGDDTDSFRAVVPKRQRPEEVRGLVAE
jgi:hypothetical protein